MSNRVRKLMITVVGVMIEIIFGIANYQLFKQLNQSQSQSQMTDFVPCVVMWMIINFLVSYLAIFNGICWFRKPLEVLKTKRGLILLCLSSLLIGSGICLLEFFSIK